MNQFVLKKKIFLINGKTKQMEIQENGVIMTPDYSKNGVCFLSCGNIQYQVSNDMFLTFFKIVK